MTVGTVAMKPARMAAEPRFARGATGRLAYAAAGSGDPAVVLVHGGLGDRSHFAAMFDHLASHHRVIALDLRGHGESALPVAEFTVADLALDVAAVCEAAGVDHAVVCGHSLSGGVAVELAVTRPELVSGVVLLDGAILYQQEALQALVTQLLPALEGEGWREAVRGLVSGRMLSPYDPPHLRQRLMHAVDLAPRQVTVPWFRQSYTWDASSRLAACRQPLLYVHSTVPVDLARLHDIRPDALMGTVVGSGHFLMMSVPEQVDAMVDRFLEIIAAGLPRR